MIKVIYYFTQNPPVPWKTLLRTKAVWAIIIVNFANGWGYYTMLSELPTYMNDVLGFDISEVTRRSFTS